MKIDSNLLVKNVHAPERQVTIPCQEIRIDTIDQEIAVRWKNARHRKRTNEVGDGMEVLRVHERKEIEFKIDPEWFLYGLSPRQEYDEKDNRVNTYLYKFSKEPGLIQVADQLIKQILSTRIEFDGRFVKLEGEVNKLFDPRKIIETLPDGGIAECLSFVLGLLVVYGKHAPEAEVIHNYIIYFPITGPIAQWNDLLIKILDNLRDYGIYTTLKLSIQREGQLLQINISDREFMQYASKFFDPIYGDSIISKIEIYQQQKEQLLTFLSEYNAPAEVVSKIEDSVLKTVRK